MYQFIITNTLGSKTTSTMASTVGSPKHKHQQHWQVKKEKEETMKKMDE